MARRRAGLGSRRRRRERGRLRPEVVGDESKDIFDGLVLSTSLFHEPKYVPSEKVRRIFEGRVELVVGSDDVKRLEEFLEPPPSLDVEAGKASWSDQVLEDVAPARETAKRVPFWKRTRAWLLSKRRD